jgi:hypothetical protein
VTGQKETLSLVSLPSTSSLIVLVLASMPRSKRAAATKATVKLAEASSGEEEDGYEPVGNGTVEEEEDEEECAYTPICSIGSY